MNQKNKLELKELISTFIIFFGITSSSWILFFTFLYFYSTRILLVLWVGYLYITDNFCTSYFRDDAILCIPGFSTVYHNMINWFSGENIIHPELDREKQYLFVTHFHGVYSACTWANYLPQCFKLFTIFKRRCRMCTLQENFYVPMWGVLLHLVGFTGANKENIIKNLKEGTNVGLMIGGASEVAYYSQKEYVTVARNRKGVFEIALKTGVPAVPVLCFGETFVYDHYEFEWFSKFQQLVKYWFKVCPILFTGWKYTFMPNPVKLSMVYGKEVPVSKIKNPSTDDISIYRDLYLTALEDLYEEYKDTLGQGLPLKIV